MLAAYIGQQHDADEIRILSGFVSSQDGGMQRRISVSVYAVRNRKTRAEISLC